MAYDRLVFGLDVGTTKVCAVIGEVNGEGGVDVIGMGTAPSLGMRKGMVVDLERTSRAVAQAVDKAERMAGADMGPVYLGVAGGHIQSTNSHGVVAVSRADREVTEADVERVLEGARAIALAPDREVLHVLPREYVLDGCTGIKDPVGMSATRLEAYVHIVTGAVSALDNVVKSVHRAGVEVADIVLEPLASGEAVLTPDEKELGAVLVDIGGGTTDVAVFYEGSIWHTAIIPVGGNNITSDLAYGLKVAVPEAERLKIQLGIGAAGKRSGLSWDSPEPAPFLPQAQVSSAGRPGSGRDADGGLGEDLYLRAQEIVKPRVEEIFGLVKREIEKAPHPVGYPTGCVVSGGTALLPGLIPLARQVTELPTRIGYPRGVGGLVDVVDSPIYATAVGLLLYALSESGQAKKEIAAVREGPSGWWQAVGEKVLRWIRGLVPVR